MNKIHFFGFLFNLFPEIVFLNNKKHIFAKLHPVSHKVACLMFYSILYLLAAILHPSQFTINKSGTKTRYFRVFSEIGRKPKSHKTLLKFLMKFMEKSVKT